MRSLYMSMPIDAPVGGVEDARRQVMADEAIDAQDQDIFHAS